MRLITCIARTAGEVPDRHRLVVASDDAFIGWTSHGFAHSALARLQHHLACCLDVAAQGASRRVAPPTAAVVGIHESFETKTVVLEFYLPRVHHRLDLLGKGHLRIERLVSVEGALGGRLHGNVMVFLLARH